MAIIHFVTQGCSANINDTEIMMGILEKLGHELTDIIQRAEIIVFNTCVVKGPSVSFFRKKLEEFRKTGKKIILSGCITQAEEDLSKYSDCSIIGVYNIGKIGEIVEEVLNGNTIVNIARTNDSKLKYPKMRRNSCVDILQIATGCLGHCTYCKTKFAKGDLISYPISEIVASIKKSVNEGIKEIWLTSQDAGAYGKDAGSGLIPLLKKIGEINGDFKVRIGMTNPNHIIDILDELIWILKNNKKFFQFLHLPLQSGSNNVLKDMKREYSVEDYIFIYRRLKEEMPKLTLATDIICGYPTETEQDITQTIKIIEEYPPDVINISRFWPMAGTSAYKLKPLPGGVVKDRSRKVTKVFSKVGRNLNNNWLKWKGTAFVDEIGKDGSFVCRNYAYKPIIVKSNLDLLGKYVTVEVFDCTEHDLRAYLLDVDD